MTDRFQLTIDYWPGTSNTVPIDSQSSSQLLLLHIKRLAREGELDLLGLETLHNLEVHSLVDLLAQPVVGRLDPIAHVNIQRPIVEIAEVHPRRPVGIGVDLGHSGQNLLHNLNRLARLGVTRVVGYGQVGRPANERTLADVFHGRIDDHAVGYRDKMPLKRPDASAPESHFLDRSGMVADLDHFAHLERPVCKNRY